MELYRLKLPAETRNDRSMQKYQSPGIWNYFLFYCKKYRDKHSLPPYSKDTSFNAFLLEAFIKKDDEMG